MGASGCGRLNSLTLRRCSRGRPAGFGEGRGGGRDEVRTWDLILEDVIFGVCLPWLSCFV